MPAKPPRWVADDDVMVKSALDPVRVGRRVEIVIDEAILRQVGARALEEATRRAGQEFVMQHQHEIHSQCVSLLMDREWLKPILEDEFRQAARELVLSLWSDEEKQVLRGWFEVLTAKCKG